MNKQTHLQQNLDLLELSLLSIENIKGYSEYNNKSLCFREVRLIKIYYNKILGTHTLQRQESRLAYGKSCLSFTTL